MYMVFDIETVPDAEMAMCLYGQAGSSSGEAINLAKDEALQRSQGTSDFLPIPLHSPVCVGLLELDKEFTCVNLGHLTLNYQYRSQPGLVMDERRLVEMFWNKMASKTLVSFNGRGFDIPVMELRAMHHSLELGWYFNEGYRKRFSDYHFDLLEFLTNFGATRRYSLNMYAAMVGLPGKYGVDGSMVEEMYRGGQIDEIMHYCMTDVLQTAFLYVHTLHTMGQIQRTVYGRSVQSIVEVARGRGIFNEFLELCNPFIIKAQSS